MFHPNVYANGDLCLDILQNRWYQCIIVRVMLIQIACRSPTYDVAAILTSIQSLLHDPNPNSPANVEAARLFTESRKGFHLLLLLLTLIEYNRKVKETVEESWM